MGLRDGNELVRAATLGRLFWLVREKPVTVVVLDGAVLPRNGPSAVLYELGRLFPSLPVVLVAHGHLDARALFEMGQAGLSELVILPADGWVRELRRATGRALMGSTDAIVTRWMSPVLPRRELVAARLAVEAALRGWGTEEMAARIGLTRPHLSVRLRAVGLPSAGRLLTWAKMFHAASWLTDPGRSGESVSRQLGYTDGSAFRRALRNYVGGTPTELSERGGLVRVLERFGEACDLPFRRGTEGLVV